MTAKSTGVKTQQEVANELGLSRARVMQLEQSAMRKIRKGLGIKEPKPLTEAEFHQLLEDDTK